MVTSTQSKPRRPGRPPGSRNLQRTRLIAAAQEVLAAPHSQELTLQRVAREAGVSTALAHYYFNNRDGLIDALITERVAPRIDDLVAATRVRAGQPQMALTFLMQRTCSLLATDSLLRRCLLLTAPGALKIRDQLRSLMRELLVRAQGARAIRTDLSPEYLTESLLGLVLFPFFDEAAAEDSSGERVAQLTLQHVALLRDGIVRTYKPSQESSA